jgi:hypothetical protein
MYENVTAPVLSLSHWNRCRFKSICYLPASILLLLNF